MGDEDYGPATQATAKWDFAPAEAGGLVLTTDDELDVWPTDKGWWFARQQQSGAEGYVPRDYVRVRGRHAEAAFPGMRAHVAAVSPGRAPPTAGTDDDLQLALALSLNEAEAVRTPPPALSKVATPRPRASAPPSSPSFAEAWPPPSTAPPLPPPDVVSFDAEALAEVPPPAPPPLPPRDPPGSTPAPEPKPTSPKSLLKSARRSIRRSLGIPKSAKASPAEVARLRQQAADAEAEASRLRGALDRASSLQEPLDETTECQVCMARAKDTALVPCGHVLCAQCVTRSNDERLVEECPVCRETVRSTMRVYI